MRNELDKKSLLKHLAFLIKKNDIISREREYDWDKIYYCGRKDSLYLLEIAIKAGGFDTKQNKENRVGGEKKA